MLCQEVMNQSGVKLTQMTRLIGCLSSTAIAIFLVPLQYWPLLQRQQILELPDKQSFNARVVLSEEVRKEIQWLIENMMLPKERTITSLLQLFITSDICLQGW